MKSFEPVFRELTELFIETLPDYIKKTNLKYNDGIILENFKNRNLTEKCSTLPCFTFSEEEAECTEKDRIIENTVFSVSFEIKMKPYSDTTIIEFWRYVESVEEMMKECGTETWIRAEISGVKGRKVIIKVTV